MNEVTMINADDDDEEPDDSTRQRGAISFPYYDLSDAEELAKAAWTIAGAGPAPLDAVAAELGHSTIKSGGFRGKLGAARLFGLTRTSGMTVTVSDLGRQIVTADTREKARVEAFLRVPLYRAIYDKYRGSTLPGDAGIEAEMVALGVTPKQKARARQGFQRSAADAGFFRAGQDKLIAPVVGGPAPPEINEQEIDDQKLPNQQQVTVSDEPLIQGLFQKLPPPGPWSDEDRQQWLDTAKSVFALIYQSEPKTRQALPSGSERPSERSADDVKVSEQTP